MKKVYQNIMRNAFLIMMFMFLSIGQLEAQKYKHLEKLVDASEEMMFPEASEDGRWLAWCIVSENGTKSMMMQNIDDSKKTFERKNIGFLQFIRNNLVVQTGDEIEFIDPETGKSKSLKYINKFLYDKKNGLFVVLSDENGEKMLQVFDTDLNLKQTIANVQYLFSNNDEIIVRKKSGSVNEVYGWNNGSFKPVFSTTNEVNKIMSLYKKLERRLFIQSGNAEQKVIHCITQNEKINLDLSEYKDYNMVDANPSLVDDHIIIKLQKKIKSKTEMVNIWYGTDFDLTEHDGVVIKTVHIDWDLKTGKKTVMTQPGYFGETAIGNSLYLVNAVDSAQVDRLDKSNGKGSDNLHLWNSLTNTYTKIADVEGQMVISPSGNFLLIQTDSDWQLYNTSTFVLQSLKVDRDMIPYFTSNKDVIWIGGSRITEQNLVNMKIKDIYKGNAENIELLDFDKVYTEIGNNRNFRTADLSKSLALKITNLKTENVSYGYLKNKRIFKILPSTPDGIKEFKKLGNKNDYFWIQENYNKRPRLVVKVGKDVPRVIYISDSNNEKFEHTELVKFSYNGSDGEKIKGNLFMPLNYDPSKKYPVVVHIYEKQNYITKRFLKPSMANGTGFNIPLLMAEGYAVLLADISQSDKGAGISALESIHNALDKMQSNKNVDMKRIGLIGQSFGGYQTNFIATHSDRFAAYVSGAAVSDVIRTYYAYNYHFKAPDYYRYERRQYWFNETVAENPEKYIRNNPIMSVQNVTAPMLLWTGTADENVSSEGTKSMFIALRKYKKPVIALFYDKEKHVMGKYETQKDLTVKVLDWFNYHLKDKRDIPWIQKYIKGAE